MEVSSWKQTADDDGQTSVVLRVGVTVTQVVIGGIGTGLLGVEGPVQSGEVKLWPPEESQWSTVLEEVGERVTQRFVKCPALTSTVPVQSDELYPSWP